MPKKVLGNDPFARIDERDRPRARKAPPGDEREAAEARRPKGSPKRVRLLEPSDRSAKPVRARELEEPSEERVELPEEHPESGEALDGEQNESTTEEEGPAFLERLLQPAALRRIGKLWGSIRLRNRSEQVDEFGKDPIYTGTLEPVWEWLYRKYWRVEVAGIRNVPDKGRALLVANHSGMLPFDGLMIGEAVREESRTGREVRFLVEDMFATLPFLAPFLARIGAVRASQRNAERLLSREELVCVFPEGVKGTGKLYRERYQLQRFGRGGFIRLCIRTNTPLVPVAVVGAEEIYPVVAKFERLARPLGLPFFAVTPGWPALGPLGLVPLPSKWKIAFGKPIRFDRRAEKAADDDALVSRLTEQVRERIQEMLDGLLAERKSVWFG